MTMTIDWGALASAALEDGRRRAAEFLENNQDFMSNFPRTALMLAFSLTPGKKKEPEYWSSMLREMTRAERSAYNKMMVENSEKAAQWTAAKIQSGAFFLDALRTLGDVANAIVRMAIQTAIEKVKPPAQGEFPSE